VLAVDRSTAYAKAAAKAVADERAKFLAADAQALPVGEGVFHAAVSGLMLNFVPDPRRTLQEMAWAVESGGMVAFYVWDYAGRMEMMRHFWDAAVALDPGARARDEAQRFPICRPEALQPLAIAARLTDVETRGLEVPTEFRDFDDYWTPFLSGEGPAPGYCASLEEGHRMRLRDALRARLPVQPDGSISLIARAWAVRGRAPEA